MTNNKQQKKKRYVPSREEKERFVKELHDKLMNQGGFKHYGTYYTKMDNTKKQTISVYLHSDCFEILVDEGGREGWFAQKHDFHPGSMKRIDELVA